MRNQGFSQRNFGMSNSVNMQRVPTQQYEMNNGGSQYLTSNYNKYAKINYEHQNRLVRDDQRRSSQQRFNYTQNQDNSFSMVRDDIANIDQHIQLLRGSASRNDNYVRNSKRRPKSGISRQVKNLMSPHRSRSKDPQYGYDAQLLNNLSNNSGGSNRNSYQDNNFRDPRKYSQRGMIQHQTQQLSPKTNYDAQVKNICYQENDYSNIAPFQQPSGNYNSQKQGGQNSYSQMPQYVQYQNQINIAQPKRSIKNQMGRYQENLSYINQESGDRDDSAQSEEAVAIMDIHVPDRQNEAMMQQQQQMQYQQQQQQLQMRARYEQQQQEQEIFVMPEKEVQYPKSMIRKQNTLKSMKKSEQFVKIQSESMVQSSKGENNILGHLHKDGVQTPATIQALNQHFFGALKGCSTEQLIAHTLLKLGFNSENTLFADSSCPDEINHDDAEEDITLLFQQRWGEVFPLAGLAGIPFTGKTGWGAFSSHIPVNGNIVVLFAPHVGIDKDGNVGKIQRDGQSCASGACGAAIGAYAALQKDETEGDFKNGMHDQQMDTIKHLLKPHYLNLRKTTNDMVNLVYTMYELIREYLEEIISLNWMGPSSKLAVCGGIMINCEGEKTDMFLPLQFDVRDKKQVTNLFYKTFGIRDQVRKLQKYGIKPKKYDNDEKESIEQD